MFERSKSYFLSFVAVSFLVAAIVLVAGNISFSDHNANAQNVTSSSLPEKKSSSGLPLPRFVSLKSDRVNVRQGPSRKHSINWVYTKRGLPVEIIAEFENWRQIRDSEGAEGWVFHSLLSGRRTILVAPWNAQTELVLYEKPEDAELIVAKLEAGIMGSLEECRGDWCKVEIKSHRGWISKTNLWGVYPDEKIE